MQTMLRYLEFDIPSSATSFWISILRHLTKVHGKLKYLVVTVFLSVSALFVKKVYWKPSNHIASGKNPKVALEVRCFRAVPARITVTDHEIQEGFSQFLYQGNWDNRAAWQLSREQLMWCGHCQGDKSTCIPLALEKASGSEVRRQWVCSTHSILQ